MKRKKRVDIKTINKRLNVPDDLELVISLRVAPDTWLAVIRERGKKTKEKKK